jgi:hypothetical protein
VAGEGLALLLVAGRKGLAGWKRGCWWLEGLAGCWWLEEGLGLAGKGCWCGGGEGLLERLLVAGEGLGLAGKGCWWLEKELLGPAGGWRKD